LGWVLVAKIHPSTLSGKQFATKTPVRENVSIGAPPLVVNGKGGHEYIFSQEKNPPKKANGIS